MSDRIKYPAAWDQASRDAMDKMFDVARAEGKWFYTTYQELWFSPDQLQEEQEHGRFIWGPINWQLRYPSERLAEMDRRLDGIRKERDSFAKQITP